MGFAKSAGGVEAVKIHPLLAAAIVTALFTIQGWTLSEIVNLKVEFAKLSVKIESVTQNQNEKNKDRIARNF